MTNNIDPNDIEDCQKQVCDLEAEAQEIRQLGMRYMVDLASMTARATRAEAALEQLQDALSVRDHQYLAVQAQIVALRAGFAMYSKIDGDDGLASANRLLAACERGDGIDQHAAPDIMAARAEIVAQRAALDRARALAEKWADMKYNGDLTTAVYHGCAEELAAVLNVKTTDGLLASEWLLRTAQAEAEVARLTTALSECCAALYGARELTGNIGNIGHAIELADAALRGQPAPAQGQE